MELREREARDQGRKPVRRHTWVPYSRISGNVKRAVLVAEDSAFWQHDGLDYAQIRESMEVNLERMEFARGASTITQQLAKNLYLSPSRNPVRKLRELLITRRLEVVLSKRRILEVYLNVIEWGDGIWGVEAAARAHFSRSAAAVSAEQAALLAGAIINPRVLDPGEPSARLRRRQRLILRRMGLVQPPSDQVVVSDPAPQPDPTPAIAPGLPVLPEGEGLREGEEPPDARPLDGAPLPAPDAGAPAPEAPIPPP
jgi:monofunctional biosynthetic peptidoglycan transglycosylase